MSSLTTAASKAKHRILFLDYARVIAMLLVVYAHLFDYNSATRLYIYAFHMPFFFIVSGILHKSNRSVQIKKHIKSLLIPALFFELLFYVIATPLFHYDIWHYAEELSNDSLINSFMVIGKDYFHRIIYGTSGANTACWFLFALFWCKIVVDIYDQKKTACIMLWLTSFILCILLHKNILYIGQAAMGLPFFLLGYLCKEQVNTFLQVRYKPYIITLLLSLTILLTFVNGRVSMAGLMFGNLPPIMNVAVFYLNALVGSFALLLLSVMIRYESTIIKDIAQSLISIVGLQFLFTESYRYRIGYSGGVNYLYIIIFSIGIICICVLVHLFFKRTVPFLIGV